MHLGESTMRRLTGLLWAIGSAALLFATSGCGETSTAAPALPALPAPSPAATADATSAPDLVTVANDADPSRQALAESARLLEDGLAALSKYPDYTAMFHRRELVEDELRDPHDIELRVRHEPFSVHMKWENGQEATYIAGANDDRMLVRKGGRLGRILGTIKLEPMGALARRECRNPITDVGLKRLAEITLRYRKRDLGLTSGVTCRELPDEPIGNRECVCYVVEYDSPRVEPVYRKSMVWIDQETHIPLAVKNYGWSEGQTTASNDEALVEHYVYTEVRFQRQLTDEQFAIGSELPSGSVALSE